MLTMIKIGIALFLVVLLVLLAFQPRRKKQFALPGNYRELLEQYVHFYAQLSEQRKKHFEERMLKFLDSVKITGANAAVEDLDRVLLAAAAIIPVFNIWDWEYVYLKEILVYPGNFNIDFDQYGMERHVLGMVGTGAMQNVMIISKWELRESFINRQNKRNTAIHEFIHLVDKMDGTVDGVPEILLERTHVEQWKQLLQSAIEKIQRGESDIDPYAATNAGECFAVCAEYFFEQPEEFRHHHPELCRWMEKIFYYELAVTA
jgi:Mlc titration factor MtfA (ptsG expression regulator)